MNRAAKAYFVQLNLETEYIAVNMYLNTSSRFKYDLTLSSAFIGKVFCCNYIPYTSRISASVVTLVVGML